MNFVNRGNVISNGLQKVGQKIQSTPVISTGFFDPNYKKTFKFIT
jgi:hypothetical protein